MLGAITGDIFAASYEFDPEPRDNVDLFERLRNSDTLFRSRIDPRR